MQDSGTTVDKIQAGDFVEYRLNTGDIASGVRGKVLAVFNTKDGKTLADVEWDNLGSPRQLAITKLMKV